MSDVRTELRRVWRRSARYRPATATGWIIALTVAAYLVQLATGGALQRAWQYAPVYSLPATGAPFEPWRMLTAALLHQPITPPGSLIGIVHIGFNMYALYLFGRPLEGVLGRARMVAVYVLGALGGSLTVLAAAFIPIAGVQTGVTTPVIGASGAVFAVLGAVAVVQRRLGVDVRALVVIIGINLALGFVLTGIAWQAHVGGLLVGALVGGVLIANRGPRRAVRARLAVGAIAAVLVVLALVPAVLVR
ncbi:rhomboid family intramembrane serine protease [Amnibacterium endophyticum]|uniref:Rhomboid family intramembrane serine protease n=1 Tax=Amnibacterium endophyticum TaxID=2109337 RepID=A0ABW4LBH5_9MICO